MLWSGICFKCLGMQSVVNKSTYSSDATYKCCTKRTISNSECERVSDIMMVVVN
jgi:hypothetical protein